MEYVADFNRQWTYLMWLCAAVGCAFPVRRVVGSLPAFTLFWFLAGGIATWQNSFGAYDVMPSTDLLSLQAFALDSAVKLLFVLTGMLLLASRRGFREWGVLAVMVFVLVNCAVIAVQFITSDDYCNSNMCGGIVGNPSMSASIMVVMLPVLGLGFAVPVTLAAVMTKASSPLGLLAVAALVLLPWRWRIASLAIVALTLAGLGYEAFNSGDRYEMWGFFLSKWKSVNAWVFGSGLGTFDVYAYKLQEKYDVKTNSWWLWIHNDWLQLVIEGGVSGGLLAAGTMIHGVRTALLRGMRSEALAMVLLSIMMITNYPLHLATTAVFSAWLSILIFRREYV